MVPQGRHRAATGRTSARWLYWCVALLVSAGATLPASSGSSPSITVTEVEGVYNVHTVFMIAQPPANAVAVLTDYARIPEFMPDVKTSRIIERTPERLIVEQSAVSKFLLFSKRVHLVLEIREDGGTIRFRDRCGLSFSVYEGAWIVTPRGGGSVITYHLMAKPSFDVPGFVLSRLLKRNAAELIAQITGAIATPRPAP